MKRYLPVVALGSSVPLACSTNERAPVYVNDYSGSGNSQNQGGASNVGLGGDFGSDDEPGDSVPQHGADYPLLTAPASDLSLDSDDLYFYLPYDAGLALYGLSHWSSPDVSWQGFQGHADRDGIWIHPQTGDLYWYLSWPHHTEGIYRFVPDPLRGRLEDEVWYFEYPELPETNDEFISNPCADDVGRSLYMQPVTGRLLVKCYSSEEAIWVDDEEVFPTKFEGVVRLNIRHLGFDGSAIYHEGYILSPEGVLSALSRDPVINSNSRNSIRAVPDGFRWVELESTDGRYEVVGYHTTFDGTVTEEHRYGFVPEGVKFYNQNSACALDMEGAILCHAKSHDLVVDYIVRGTTTTPLEVVHSNADLEPGTLDIHGVATFITGP